jgi:hypothetical protein
MGQVCEEFHEWVEEEVERPVEEWVEKRVEKCRKRKCRKLCLCCNKWFCWIETIVEKVVTWVVITVGKWVVRVVCEVVNTALDALAGIVGIILAFPIIGRLIRQIWSGLIDLVWRLLGIPGLILDWLGVDWEKNYRVCVIILIDEREQALTTPADLMPTIDSAKAIWKAAANVRLIIEDIHTAVDRRDRNLDVDCDFGAWTDDILLTGSNFELLGNVYCFDGTGRRLIGWASPVVVFMVRDVKDKRGCSLGPFSDYVTVEAKDPRCFAHELGHATYPWGHHSDPNNLMFSSCGGTELKGWQRALIRNSRHVTYL